MVAIHRRERDNGTPATLLGMGIAAAVTHLARKRLGELRAMFGGMASGLAALGTSYAALKRLRPDWFEVSDCATALDLGNAVMEGKILAEQRPAHASTAEEYDARAGKMLGIVAELSKEQVTVRTDLAKTIDPERRTSKFGDTGYHCPPVVNTDFPRSNWHIHLSPKKTVIFDVKADDKSTWHADFVAALEKLGGTQLVKDTLGLLYQNSFNMFNAISHQFLFAHTGGGSQGTVEVQEFHIAQEDNDVVFRAKFTQVYSRLPFKGALKHGTWRVSCEAVYVNGQDGCTVIIGKPKRVK